jgi:hypothetical protein
MVCYDGILCSAKQKTLGIPEANSQNYVPHHSAEENVQNFIPWNKIEANSLNSVLIHSEEEKTKIKANFRNFVPKHFAGENFKKDNL